MRFVKNTILGCLFFGIIFLLTNTYADNAVVLPDATTYDCGYSDFASWRDACNKLPKPAIPWTQSNYLLTTATPLTKNCFIKLLDTFISKRTEALQKQSWVNGEQSVLTGQKFDPFIAKVELPNNAVIAFHGDLHGDVHSLNAFIRKLQNDGYMSPKDEFNIRDSRFYMVFLGDYTDRGLYGMEVMYTILRLKLANPERVFLVRGNHEDLKIINRFGFEDELKRKFELTGDYTDSDFEGIEPNVSFWKQFGFIERTNSALQKDLELCLGKLNNFYNTLPVALYLGTKNIKKNQKDFILCCHGGIEIGSEENVLLESNEAMQNMKIGPLKRETHLAGYSQAIQDELRAGMLPGLQDINHYEPFDLGFMWNDFQVDTEDPTKYSYGRGWKVGKSLLLEYLKKRTKKNKYAVRGVFRAHQHSRSLTPMMARILNIDEQSPRGEEGIGKIWERRQRSKSPKALWDGIVATFLVAPLTPYSITGYDYDAYGLLKLAPNFDKWKLEVVRTDKNAILN